MQALANGRVQQFQPVTYMENVTEAEQADEVAQYSKLLGSIKSEEKAKNSLTLQLNDDIDPSVMLSSPVSMQNGSQTVQVVENDQTILANLEEYLINSRKENDAANKTLVGMLKDQYLSPKSQNQTAMTMRSMSQSKSSKTTNYTKVRSQSMTKTRSNYNRSATRNVDLSKIYTKTCFSRKKSMPA